MGKSKRTDYLFQIVLYYLCENKLQKQSELIMEGDQNRFLHGWVGLNKNGGGGTYQFTNYKI